MARLDMPPNAEISEQLAAIETASLRAAELCRQMLAYAGKGRFVVEAADLTNLTEDLLPLLRVSIAQQATLHLQLERGLPAVMADATQIRQIVMNLVLNAVDAIASSTHSKTGEVTLKTGLVRVDNARLTQCVTGAGLPEGEYVFLEVIDSGCGMTPAVQAKIFDPFFTTKFAGRGLGLAAVLGIVRGHRGALEVESAPGRGSVFRLLLPPAKGAVAAKSTGAQADARRKYSGRVLVIEDEESVRTVTVAMLRSFGFTAHSAVDGQAGFGAFRENPNAVDLVLLDMVMPPAHGETNFDGDARAQAHVRVLLMSGFSEGDLLRRLGGARRSHYFEAITRDASNKAAQLRARQALVGS